MKASKDLISDLARQALNGERASFVLLMQILEETNHPILSEIDRKFRGRDVLRAVASPLSQLVEGYPKPSVFTESIVWNGPDGRHDNGSLPAEVWFDNPYIAYFKNGKRHRNGIGPTVIDVSNGTIAYYLNGEPRRHSKGPFKVEHDNGHAMLTYIMDDRMVTRKGHIPIDDRGNVEFDDEDNFEEPAEGGAHVIITRDHVDIEGLGRSEPTAEDLRNLGIWRTELVNWLGWGSGYVREYLNKFR